VAPTPWTKVFRNRSSLAPEAKNVAAAAEFAVVRPDTKLAVL